MTSENLLKSSKDMTDNIKQDMTGYAKAGTMLSDETISKAPQEEPARQQ